MPLKTTTLKPQSPRTRMVKTCRKRSIISIGRLTYSLADPETLTIFDLYAQSRTPMRGRLNGRALMRTNEGEPCRLWALHQPWSGEPPASSLPAGLREPPPLCPRRWCPGRMAREGVDAKRHHKARRGAKSRRHREKATAGTNRHLRRCRRRAGANKRRCHERAGAGGCH